MRNVLSRGGYSYTIPAAKPGDTPAKLCDCPGACVDGGGGGHAHGPALPGAGGGGQPAPRKPTRKERRRNEVFNRQLKRRLEKENLPATVAILPDGGIHVTVKKPEEA